MKIGIAVFPGSNCDRDVHYVLNKVVGVPAEFVWHTRENITGYNAFIIPGGFAYGDRLRAGVIASQSPIMGSIKKLARDGMPVLGICNGFQILVEAGLLPGALMMNSKLRFVCGWTQVRVENTETPFTSAFAQRQQIAIPVAHGEGRYVVDSNILRRLRARNQVVMRYVGDDPNGSTDLIAAVCNEESNVVGMMPHPERSSESILSPSKSADAILVFRSLCNHLLPKTEA